MPAAGLPAWLGLLPPGAWWAGHPGLTVSPLQEFLVTLRLHRATLRHFMALPEQSWHSQVSKSGVGRRASGLGVVEASVRGLGWARADFQVKARGMVAGMGSTWGAILERGGVEERQLEEGRGS